MRAMMSDYNLCCRPQARTNVNNLGERCTAEISASARSPRAVILAICYFVCSCCQSRKLERRVEHSLSRVKCLFCIRASSVPRMGKIIEKVLISVAFSELKVSFWASSNCIKHME
ncbi:hypothetical protein HN51_063372 [Arachis hypogaea]